MLALLAATDYTVSDRIGTRSIRHSPQPGNPLIMRQGFSRRLLPFLFAGTLLATTGCSRNDRSDGFGNFESTEVIVSSEANGRLISMPADEGVTMQAGSVAAVVDTTQLVLSRRQLLAERDAILSKEPGLGARIAVLREERKNVRRDFDRYQRLYKEGAVASRQFEEYQNRIELLDRQIIALETENPGIRGEIASRDARIAQLDDQIAKSVVRNPVAGVVLATYAEQGEITTFGKALYKIADLGTMYLRVYLDGTQIPQVRIGQKVEVLVDDGKAAGRRLEGRISWISPKAEFTPKIVQTREDRVTMVYAVKVKVLNPDGRLSIGMPGEIRLPKERGS